ncbi:MAG TPA: hypothetical protein VF974_02055 [Patescibacteria group bacterium]
MAKKKSDDQKTKAQKPEKDLKIKFIKRGDKNPAKTIPNKHGFPE